MAYIDCLIDTHPMANEMSSVSSHIKGTTAAVVGMKAAVVAAENAAADHVCENVNKGFYTLIHSQISQKIAKLQSEVDSHLMKLNQLRKQLLAIQGRMERDYGMISQRYLKLFNGLNKNLEMRVFDLDRPTIDFAVKDISAISNRSHLLPATVPVSQTELIEVSQKIISSNIKYRGLGVIEAMSKYLGDLCEQEKLTERVLLNTPVARAESPVMLPVIVSEAQMDKYGNTRMDIEVARAGLNKNTTEQIRSAVSSMVMNAEWQDAAPEGEVKNEFHKMLADSGASERVKEMTRKLFDTNGYQTLKN